MRIDGATLSTVNSSTICTIRPVTEGSPTSRLMLCAQALPAVSRATIPAIAAMQRPPLRNAFVSFKATSPFLARSDRLRREFRLADFRHGHTELVAEADDLAARDQAVVDVDVDVLADLAVELEHGAAAEPQQLAHRQVGRSQHHRDLHGDVVHGREVGAAGFAADRARQVAA